MPTPDGTGPHASCTGQELVSIERARQLHEKAITVQRDDATHRPGNLALSAACYEHHGTEPQPPPEWPERLEWDPQRNDVAALVRAGALYQAEIDRLQHRLDRVIARIDGRPRQD
jgi:hypothetical protein